MAANSGSWCVVYLGDDFNWWIQDMSDEVSPDTEMMGILDPKQVEHMVDLLSQLRKYGLNDEIVNGAFITYTIDREMPKEMLRLCESKGSAMASHDPIFCLPNTIGDGDGPFSEFIDHIMALRVKLLNFSFDFKRPLNAEEIEDILHADQQERYIAGVKTHAFDEIMSILDYVPAGYNLDEDIDDESGELPDDELDLSAFDDVDHETVAVEDGRSRDYL
ncbi:MAG: hypothetical protein LBB18_00180 [Puniceicoccales bacterium]|nr:hypothetical protein [Puniceicoccales bacterium]